ncbi:MAG: flavodoxin domain-containing protein [Chloroflexota bacterium]
MASQILVVYATLAGSTAEIAEVVAHTLRCDGIGVDLRRVNNAPASLSEYTGVVVGSAVRDGEWLPSALDFIRHYADRLARRPVAYFTVCMILSEDTMDRRRRARQYVEPAIKLAKPTAIGLFAGSLDPARLTSTAQHSAQAQGLPVGDFRDWDRIRSWAHSLRRRLVPAHDYHYVSI